MLSYFTYVEYVALLERENTSANKTLNGFAKEFELLHKIVQFVFEKNCHAQKFKNAFSVFIVKKFNLEYG